MNQSKASSGIRQILRRIVLALTSVFGLGSTVRSAGDQGLTVVNKTEFDIRSLHVSPHNSDGWGDDVTGKDTLRGGVANATFE